jgi:hypothetical protein
VLVQRADWGEAREIHEQELAARETVKARLDDPTKVRISGER